MNPDPQLELQVLLRSSGELPAAAQESLDQALNDDADAADFAHFIDHELPAAATAPRDFADAAIVTAAMTESPAPRDFAATAINSAAAAPSPSAWRWVAGIAAAAAAATLALLLPSEKTPALPPGPRLAAVPTPSTAALSQRISNLEQDLAQTPRRRNRFPSYQDSP